MDPLRHLRETDIYLIDLILRDRVPGSGSVLDVGAGSGRNLPWFLAQGREVFVVERDPDAMHLCQRRASQLGFPIPAERAYVGDLASAPFPDHAFSLVLGNALLHFAPDRETFFRWGERLGAWVAPGGMLFLRFASRWVTLEGTLPLEDRPEGWFRLPDGSERFLPTERDARELSERLGATLAEPPKTVVVHGLRTMTNWILTPNSRPVPPRGPSGFQGRADAVPSAT